MFIESNMSKAERLEACKKLYRKYGYDMEKEFPEEYLFMYNSHTGECVRLYKNGRVEEYLK